MWIGASLLQIGPSIKTPYRAGKQNFIMYTVILSHKDTSELKKCTRIKEHTLSATSCIELAHLNPTFRKILFLHPVASNKSTGLREYYEAVKT